VLHIRAAVQDGSIAAEVRKLAFSTPEIVFSKVITARQQVNAGIMEHLVLARISVAIGVMASLTVGFGIFGFLAYSLHCRKDEFAVRMALGCSPRRLLGAIAKRLALQIAGGIAVGLLLALIEKKLLAAWLYGVAALDPLSVVIASVLVVAASAFALYRSTRQLYEIDPSRLLQMW
jgi:ABC-type antimicrobial peptide transport system permease subunit